MKKYLISFIVVIVVLIFLLVQFFNPFEDTETEKLKTMNLPENSYNIKDIGNGWISFSLDSNQFIIYTQTHQRCITQVK